MRSRTEADYRRRILRVRLHLEANLDARFTLEELAAIACFSPFHFHRIFRALVGEPVQEHLRRLRLQRAARQLATTRRTVTAIAFAAGYDALESFSRAFRDAFGLSPSRFRAQARATVPGSARPRSRPRAPLAVTIRHIEPIPLVFLRHAGPYDEVSATWERLLAWAGERGLLRAPFRMIGISHDDPALADAARIRYDACLALTGDVVPCGDVACRTIPGGEYAVLEHVGPYQELDSSYRRLYGEWLPASGREPADAPAFDLYPDPPDSAPALRRTLIHIPLQPLPGR